MAKKPFTAYEWMVIKTAWANLIEDGKVITDNKTPVSKNMQLLVKEVANDDKDLQEHLKGKLHAISKKYN